MNSVKKELVDEVNKFAEKVLEAKEKHKRIEKLFDSLRNADVIKGKTWLDFQTSKKIIKCVQYFNDYYDNKYRTYIDKIKTAENYYQAKLNENKRISNKYKKKNKLLRRRPL